MPSDEPKLPMADETRDDKLRKLNAHPPIKIMLAAGETQVHPPQYIPPAAPTRNPAETPKEQPGLGPGLERAPR